MAAGGSGKRRISATPSTTNHHKINHKTTLDPNLLNLLSSVTASTSTFLSNNDLNLPPAQTLALETLLASTSKSLHLLTPKSTSTTAAATPHRPTPNCWFHRFLDDAISPNDPRWIESFRMSSNSFSLLLSTLTPHLHAAFPNLPPNYILGAAIFRLAHGASYRSVAKRFAMDSSEACRAFFVVCKSVNESLGHYFEIHSASRIMQSVGWMNLPNCCGVLGLERFEVDGNLFGENGAVMVQAVVDSEGRFVDVSAGWPSSMDAGTILKQTKLYAEVEDNKLLCGEFLERVSDGMSVPQYLLGDGCYPLLPWLMTPYPRINEEDSFNLKEQTFNAAHEKAMKMFKLAFARVRARWRLLGRQWMEESIEFLPFVIVTGCLLHNFLTICQEYFPEVEDEIQWVNGEGGSEGEDLTGSAHRIRGSLANHLVNACATRMTSMPEDLGNAALSKEAGLHLY